MRLSEIGRYDSSFESHFCHLPKDVSFSTLSPLNAIKPNSITFLKNKVFLKEFLQSQYCKEKSIRQVYLLIAKSFFETLRTQPEFNILSEVFSGVGVVSDIDLAMVLLSRPYYELKHSGRNEMVDGRQMGSAKVHPTAEVAQNVFIGENVEISEGVTIYPGTVIMGHCRIGPQTTIYPNVSINSDVFVGAFCRIHSNTVIGSDGFGYYFHGGKHLKVWHLGGVVIGDHVELGANCTIDRGSFKDTLIGDGTKLDNVVHVAHNCVLGKGAILCAQTGLSGSVEIGNYTLLGGKVGAAPNVSLGDRCEVAGGAMIKDSWPAGSKLGGFPATSHLEWAKSLVAIKKLI